MSSEKSSEKSYNKEKNGKKKLLTDIYLDELEDYQNKYGQKTCIYIQVGDFWEIYGYQSSDGKRRGVLWEVSELCNINVSLKKVCSGSSDSEEGNIYMAGFPFHVLDKFLNILVQKHGWTVIVIKQDEQKAGTSRSVMTIATPGINMRSNNDSNNLVSIYLEKSSSFFDKKKSYIYSGISSMDCLTGENTIYETYNTIDDTSLIFDELHKFISVKNPSEVLIQIDSSLGFFNKHDSTDTDNNLDNNTYNNLDNTKEGNIIKEENLKNALGLHDRHYKINYLKISEKEKKISFQEKFFEKIFPNNLQISILDQLGLNMKEYGRFSYYLLLLYINEHSDNILQQIDKPEIWENNNQFILANNSLEQLNVIDNQFNYGRTTNLLNLLNETSTVIGKRAFKKRLLNPIRDINIINNRYQQIEEMIDLINDIPNKNFYMNFEKSLRGICDLEKLHRKFAMGQFTPYDLNNIDNSYKSLYELVDIIEKLDINKKPMLKSLQLDKTTLNILNNFITDYKNTFDINKCYYSTIEKIDKNIFHFGHCLELDQIQNKINYNHQIIETIANELSNLINEREKKTSTMLETVRVDHSDKKGYYIYTTSRRFEALINKIALLSNKTLEIIVPKNEIINGKNINKKIKITIDLTKLKNTDKSTGSTNKDQIINIPKIDEISKELDHLYGQIKQIIPNSFINKIKEYSIKYIQFLGKIINFIGEIDVIKSCAKTAINNGYVRPIIKPLDTNNNKSYIDIKGLRHPIVERIQKRIPYIPNDIQLSKNNIDGLLLFGVNASGKSTNMKAIGLNLIMAQSGMYVSASEFVYYPYEYLFTRIWNNDNIYKGQSTFAVEVSELKSILSNANQKSIVLGDELCSGTETISASAIVSAGIITLAKRQASFIFATHLHFLSSNTHINNLSNVKKYHLSVRYDQERDILIYDRILKEGSGPSTYGLEVCKSMGLESEFMNLANQIRKEITNDNLESFLGKSSIYNSNKFVSNCEICQKRAEDVHHIKFQCTADLNGMIGQNHMNLESNLVSLCKECHNDVHNGKLQINGYIMTNQGIILDFKILNDTEISQKKNKKKKLSESEVREIQQILFENKQFGQKARQLTIREWKNRTNSDISPQIIKKIEDGNYF